jgi:hypothetical protein
VQQMGQIYAVAKEKISSLETDRDIIEISPPYSVNDLTTGGHPVDYMHSVDLHTGIGPGSSRILFLIPMSNSWLTCICYLWTYYPLTILR